MAGRPVTEISDDDIARLMRGQRDRARLDGDSAQADAQTAWLIEHGYETADKGDDR